MIASSTGPGFAGFVSERRPDVVVVGAGIIGAACAMELANAGRSVALVEAVGVASDTSCRAMGHIGVYDDTDDQLVLTRYALERWAEIAPELPAEVEYVRRGALWVAATEEDMREVERKSGVYERAGVAAKVVDSEGLAGMEPNLRSGLPGALHVPGDVVLDAAEATKFLARRAVELGAELRIGHRVRALLDHGVALEGGGEIPADHTVLATGWRAPELLPSLPIRPRKGHIALTAPAPGYVRHQISEVGYVRGTDPEVQEAITFSFQPRTSGRYLIGATRQYVGASTAVDPSVMRRLMDRAREFLPRVEELPLERTWAGLRPAGPDAVPLIGPLPGRPRLLLAVAHEGIGITTCLATGRMITDLITGAPSELPLARFLPSRLPWLAQGTGDGPRPD
jgi:D-hydroxyproline dehydrogenase subunit beta